MAAPVTIDLASGARGIVRWAITVGAAVVYAVIVFRVGVDAWVGNDKVTLDPVLAGVINSVSITLGSAFVGWVGVRGIPNATINVAANLNTRQKFVAITRGLFGQVTGALVLAMAIYIVVGAFAGITYIFNRPVTPTALITVATAWAAQASAVVAATLATATSSS